MLCLGLSRNACFWMLEVRRRVMTLIGIQGYFGLTGGVIAIGLLIVGKLGRCWRPPNLPAWQYGVLMSALLPAAAFRMVPSVYEQGAILTLAT